MASSWNSSSPGFLLSKSSLPLTEIMENGFVAGISSINSSPLDDINTPTAESWDSNLDLNIVKSMPQFILKVSESSPTNCSNGGGIAGSTSLTSLCKTPVALASHLLDLSSLAAENNSKFNNSVADFFGDHKISTPCKEKNQKVMGMQASKSLESSAALIDLSALLKPAPLTWEISEITPALDNTLSLEASVEEMRSPVCSVELHKAVSLEMSSLAVAMCIPWIGATPRKNSMRFESFGYEKQLSKAEST